MVERSGCKELVNRGSMRVATGQRIMSYEFLLRRHNEVWEWVWLFNELIINDTNALETGISKKFNAM